MEYTLTAGRPENCAERLVKEQRCYDLLDSLHIAYERVDHPAAATMNDCDEVAITLGCGICKNLFLCNRQKTNFYLLTMPAHKTFKTKELSAQLGVARLSFADEDLLADLLDLTPGSVTVMGLMNDTEQRVRLLVDADLQKPEYFACHPMINTSSIRFKTKDLFETLLPALHHQPTFVELHGEEPAKEG